jgi:hypothetical protein
VQLKLSPHDEQIRAAAADAVRGVFGATARSRPLLGDIDPSTLTLAAPHVGYTLGLAELRVGAALSSAKPYAHRYLLLSEGRAVGSVDLCPVGSGEAFDAARVGVSPYDAPTLDSLATLRDAEIGHQDDYEPRFLIVPALYFAALWLHGPVDYIAPLLAEIEGLKEKALYEAPEAAAELTKAALAKPSFPAPDSGT